MRPLSWPRRRRQRSRSPWTASGRRPRRARFVGFDQRIEIESIGPHRGRHRRSRGGTNNDVCVIGMPTSGQLDGHQRGKLICSAGDSTATEHQTNSSHIRGRTDRTTSFSPDVRHFPLWALRAATQATGNAPRCKGCHAPPIQWGPVGLSVWEADEWSRLAGEHFVLSGVVTSVSGPCPGRLVNLPVALLGCRAVEHLPIGL